MPSPAPAAHAATLPMLPGNNPANHPPRPVRVPGWKFWVPAASVNFAAVPLQYQIWYMSACGLLWVAYLSYSSTRRVNKA